MEMVFSLFNLDFLLSLTLFKACHLDLLFKNIQKGDEISFKKLFSHFYPLLVASAQKYLYDKALSEDIVQDIFVHLWENATTIKIYSSLEGYLHATVRNRCLNHLRTIKITDDQSIIEHLNSADSLEDNVVEFSPKQEEALQIIEKFPARMREIIQMKYVGNYSYYEIASELNISVETVKTQIKRARKKASIFGILVAYFWC